MPEDSTPYQETEALLAVMDGDAERCEQILAGMLDGELVLLRKRARELSILCQQDLARRRSSESERRGA